MTHQKYERYWSCTLAYTDIQGNKFNRCLGIILNFVDTNSQKAYSEQKYEDLQSEIRSVFHLNDVSIRKAINQFVKLGFVDNELSSYSKDSRSFLIASNKEKKKTLFSKIVYSNASFDNSVTDHSQRKEINFLLKTLNAVKELDKSDILALMTTDIASVTKGFLTRAEIEEAKRFVDNIDFLERKYNQLGHFWSVLKNLDDLNIQGSHLCFKEDASYLGLDTDGTGIERDPYLHRMYRNQLIEESKELFGGVKPRCMLVGKEHPGLVASHIKPFRHCTEEEAYDPNNGLLLNPNNDELFDSGYIAFQDNGKIILSDRLSAETKDVMCTYYLNPIFLNTERIKYLKYNREYVFK